jgi:hypothetical protein
MEPLEFSENGESYRLSVLAIAPLRTYSDNQIGSGFEYLGAKDKAKETVQVIAGQVVEVGVDVFTSTISALARGFQREMDDLVKETQFTKAKLEFGLAVDLSGDVYILNAGSNVNVKVTLDWNRKSVGTSCEATDDND